MLNDKETDKDNVSNDIHFDIGVSSLDWLACQLASPGKSVTSSSFVYWSFSLSLFFPEKRYKEIDSYEDVVTARDVEVTPSRKLKTKNGPISSFGPTSVAR